MEQVVLYRLVDQESQAVLLVAEDVRGFFIDPEQEPPDTVTFARVHHIADARRKLERTELQVLNHQQERIGAYYIGRTLPAVSGPGVVEYSFFGHACEYPKAGEVWQRWASRRPVERDEWASYPVEYHESWLHVVQTAWFAAHRVAAWYGSDEAVSIDGARATTRAGFYCALGEAVNGPGGYFGSNLDALADCLSFSRETFPVVWRDFPASRELLGAEFTASVVAVMQEFDVEVTLGGR